MHFLIKPSYSLRKISFNIGVVGLVIILLPTLAIGKPYMPGYPDYVPIPTQNIEEDTTIYPDVNSEGFIEMKVSGRDHTDDLEKLDTIRSDEYYKKIPNDIVKGTLKLDTRYDIQLDGKLDKDTDVKYSIQKEPDFPGNYNVYIKKKETEITFGDFNTQYSSGAFLNIEKYLNGVQVESSQGQWSGKATIGKEKSEPQKYETYGNGGRKYKVGKSFLLEGSVNVYLNNVSLTENKDYSVNYYDGSITFVKNITKVDYIKVIYEFTNPIQDFIPSLSRKNFTGVNYIYSPSQNITISKAESVSTNETIIVDIKKILYNRVFLSNTPIVLGSETIYLNNNLLTRVLIIFLKMILA